MNRLRLSPVLFLSGLLGLFVAGAWPEDLPLWRTVGIVCGWGAAALLLGSLLLMVRAPRWAAAMGGLEAMYVWHHRAGVGAYLCALLHPLALAAQASMESPSQAWATLAPWMQDVSVVWGWAALMLLMAGLWATFERRLHYRPWLLLHLGLGGGVIVAWVHVLLLLAEPALAWTGVGVSVGALWWRVVAMDRGGSSTLYRIVSVRHPAREVVEVTLQSVGVGLAPSPGQFVLAQFPDLGSSSAGGEFHPFTVSRVGADGSLDLDIKALGPCTTRVQEVVAGQRVRLQGPFGDFLEGAGDRARLWVAGGIGITPFMAALRQQACPVPTTLIYLYRTAQDALFVEELERLQANDPHLTVHAVETGDAAPPLGPLLDGVEVLADREAFVCGPYALTAAVSEEWRARGQPLAALHHERFDFRS